MKNLLEMCTHGKDQKHPKSSICLKKLSVFRLVKDILQQSVNRGSFYITFRNLYTYGSNKYGQLGNGTKDNQKEPKIISYFQKKGIKIKEALCGDRHTIALTHDGQVYTFGNGGKARGAIWNFYNVFASKASPLGHGNQ